MIININYINLYKRTDRKKHIENVFNNSKKINIKRFNAIKNDNGAVGCYLSHIALLKDAINKNEKYVFIIEDDFDCTSIETFETKLESILNNDNINFDVLLFGGNILPNYKKINNDCVQVFHSQTTTGYCVASHYFETLLNHYKEGVINLMKNPESKLQYAIDRFWIHLQQKDKWLIIFPLMVFQKENDYSDIEKKIVNYKNIMLDSEKIFLKGLSF